MLFLLLNLISLSFAVTVEVIGPKNDVILPATKFNANISRTLGEITVAVFENQGINFDGDAHGMKSISGYENYVEVVSSTEFKAYGWCFSVNGVAPDTMSDQTYFENEDDILGWYFAFAHYKDGEWISQCRPAN